MQQKKGFLDLLYQNLSSMRLTVLLFLTLAVCSIVGTLLPQGTSLEELARHYGPSLSWWIDTIGLNDLYRTGWFRAILLLLCVNLIVCTTAASAENLETSPASGRADQPRETGEIQLPHRNHHPPAAGCHPHATHRGNRRHICSPATDPRLRGLLRRGRTGPMEPPDGLHHSLQCAGDSPRSAPRIDLWVQGIHEFSRGRSLR